MTILRKNEIFVFGSNKAGRHGAGAALHARLHFGAVAGVGEGLCGRSYALPTKDHRIKTLPLASIRDHVAIFTVIAHVHHDLDFLVTAIGCGLAGYEPREIAPMFEPTLQLENVYLPAEFCAALANATRVSFDRAGKRVKI